MFLGNDKIYLRPISIDDASTRYLSWINSKEVTKGMLTGKIPTNLEQLKRYLESVSNDKNSVMLAICEKNNDLHIGNVKLDQFDWVGHTAMFGIMIGDKDFWGKGIGTMVCELVGEYAFNTLNLRKLTLSVYDNNPAAVGLYEKSGFVQEGRLRKHVFADGVYYDKIYMSKFREEV